MHGLGSLPRELPIREHRDVIPTDVEHLRLLLHRGGHAGQTLARAVDRDLGAAPQALAFARAGAMRRRNKKRQEGEEEHGDG